MAKAVPEGYHTVTAYLVVKNAAEAIEFYKRAFGAQEKGRMAGPGGQGVMHAEIQIGDSRVMLSDELPGSDCQAPESLGGTTCQLFLYVNDIDAAYRRALAAGANSTMPPADMFWGDRYCKLTDPYGHSWGMATHKEDVAPAEMEKRAKAFFEQMAKQGAGA